MPGYKDSAKETGTGTCIETAWDIGDYGKCRDRLYFQLINTEKNRGLLEKAPHMEVMDLSLACYVLLSSTAEGMVSVMVTDSLAGCWGVPAGAVMAQAVQNAPKILPVRTDTLQAMAEKLSGTEDTGGIMSSFSTN